MCSTAAPFQSRVSSILVPAVLSETVAVTAGVVLSFLFQVYGASGARVRDVSVQVLPGGRGGSASRQPAGLGGGAG